MGVFNGAEMASVVRSQNFSSAIAGAWMSSLMGEINWVVSGTFVGQVTWECSFDGGTTALRVLDLGGAEVRASGPRQGTFVNREPGVLFRPVVLTYTSGTIVARASCGPMDA
jgi:hypothetical protein